MSRLLVFHQPAELPAPNGRSGNGVHTNLTPPRLGPLSPLPVGDTVQVSPSWQGTKGESVLGAEGGGISCSCDSYISGTPLCVVWQRQNDGCHLSYGLKEVVGKGI